MRLSHAASELVPNLNGHQNHLVTWTIQKGTRSCVSPQSLELPGWDLRIHIHLYNFPSDSEEDLRKGTSTPSRPKTTMYLLQQQIHQPKFFLFQVECFILFGHMAGWFLVDILFESEVPRQFQVQKVLHLLQACSVANSSFGCLNTDLSNSKVLITFKPNHCTLYEEAWKIIQPCIFQEDTNRNFFFGFITHSPWYPMR